MTLWSKFGSSRTEFNISWVMSMRCCIWMKLTNFGTNFEATRVMPKSLVKIEWHETIDIFRSSAASLKLIRRLTNTIVFSSSMFSSVVDVLGRCGTLFVVYILSALVEHFVPPINVASVQGSFTICQSQHSECVRARNFVFNTKFDTDSLIHFME